MRTLAPCSVALLLALAAAPLPAQDRVTYDLDIRDVYGNPMRPPEVTTIPTASGTRSYVSTRSVNGNRVKLESVTEKIVQQDAHTRIIERTVQRYDPNGNPVGLERDRITEVQNSDGTLSSATEKYRSDVNGNMGLVEKDETVARKTGPSTIEASTTVSRPDINGGFGTVERDEIVRNASAEGQWAETKTVMRKGENGFYEANKLVTEHSERNHESTENRAEYEIGSSGALELHQQITEHTVTNPDGSSSTVTDYFNRHAPGYAVTSDQQLALRAREVREHRVEGTRGALDTLSVQQPSISDPSRLEAPKLVSETVCTGTCK